MSTPPTTSTPVALSILPRQSLRQSTREPAERAVALTILQTVQHRQFASLPEAFAYVRSLSPEDRFELVTEQAARLIAVHDGVDEYMECLENFARSDDAFNNRMVRRPDVWQKISEGAGRARTSEMKKQQAVKKCV